MEKIQGRNNKAKSIDPLTFNEWSRENAWALGILTADGNFNKARPNEFALNSVILEDLLAFREVFKSDKDPYAMKKNENRYGKKTVYRITLSNPTITGFLKSIGAYGPKDNRNPFQNIPDEYKWSFIKGLFDGDGNCTNGNFRIAGREDLITEVYHWLCAQIYKEPNKVYTSTSTSRTRFFEFGKGDTQTIVQLLEKNTAGTYVSAKYQNLLSFV